MGSQNSSVKKKKDSEHVQKLNVVKQSTVPFPKEGIRLPFFQEFIISCGGRTVLEGMSTADVCDTHVKPVTKNAQSSYCELLAAQDYKSCRESAVGTATVFISHAWKCLFLDVVDALEYHFRTEPNIIVWFDLFR